MGWGDIGAGPGGIIHYAYAQHGAGSDYGDVYYVRSTDNGSTWSTPLKLNTDGGTRSPVAALALGLTRAATCSSAGTTPATRRATASSASPASRPTTVRPGATTRSSATRSARLPLQPDGSVQACYTGDYDRSYSNDGSRTTRLGRRSRPDQRHRPAGRLLRQAPGRAAAATFPQPRARPDDALRRKLERLHRPRRELRARRARPQRRQRRCPLDQRRADLADAGDHDHDRQLGLPEHPGRRHGHEHDPLPGQRLRFDRLRLGGQLPPRADGDRGHLQRQLHRAHGPLPELHDHDPDRTVDRARRRSTPATTATTARRRSRSRSRSTSTATPTPRASSSRTGRSSSTARRASSRTTCLPAPPTDGRSSPTGTTCTR